MRKKELYRKLKEHPVWFDRKEKGVNLIDEKDIPPIPSWFYEIKEEERKRQRKKRLRRALIAVPACAVAVLVMIVTPLGATLADGLYQMTAQWAEDSGSVSVYYGDDPEYEFPHESSLPERQEFNNLEEVRKQYGILLAENVNHSATEVVVTEIADLGYEVTTTYQINDSIVKIYNMHFFERMEHSGNITATTDSFKPIDTVMQGGTRVVGIYDGEGAIAEGYYDKLIISITTDTLPYDEFIQFIQTTEIK